MDPRNTQCMFTMPTLTQEKIQKENDGEEKDFDVILTTSKSESILNLSKTF